MVHPAAFLLTRSGYDKGFDLGGSLLGLLLAGSSRGGNARSNLGKAARLGGRTQVSRGVAEGGEGFGRLALELDRHASLPAIGARGKAVSRGGDVQGVNRRHAAWFDAALELGHRRKLNATCHVNLVGVKLVVAHGQNVLELLRCVERRGARRSQ